MPNKRSNFRCIVSDNDLKRLLAQTATLNSFQDLHDALMIVATTGLRKGELAGLRWSDIDFDRHCLVVGGRSLKTRQAFLNHQTLAILLARRQRDPDAEVIFGRVLVNRLGCQLRRISQHLGIECKFHLLRRTFATRLGNSGVDVLTSCTLLGVSYPRGIELFGHPKENTLKRAADGVREV